MDDQTQHNGTVSQVLAGPGGITASSELPRIECTFDGIEQDRHCGRTKPAGVREKYVKKGTEILNLRQISLVSKEELQEIAQEMGVEKVTGADLGANVVVRGIDNFTALPPGTILRIGSQCLLFITGENLPCVHPGKNIQARYPDMPRLAAAFPKAALGRRGLVAIVLHPGTIFPGNPIEIV